ncbi:hypothetical protein M1K46_20745 [Fictibacillus sp. WQ 8-8]|uniref:anti-sigma-I factor RsgI family protein n=1 Tax=Fictibacillus sp. WQ 8-8 TaxID=2938788 RepID=UPI00210ABD1B|nr:hypothetical protein [Fictibacillus sp. WQ 8-8]MCQ6268053.1 hypothetical protein [Fictibacillus sp. WQ 8-8]
MTKGIVVEVKRRHLIVLSEGGIFRKVKISNRQYTVGSDIYLPNELEKQRTFRLPTISWKTTTVFMMTFILLFFQFSPYTGQGVYAYVGIEMNPSIELEIDGDMLVQNITAYNSDGKKLLAILEDWQNQPIEEVTEKIFEICRAKGFIKPNQEVIVTTTINKDVSKETQRKIEQKINSLMEKKAQENKIDMTSLIMSNQERKRAKKIGVSPGKYAIFIAAKEAGIEITKADIKQKSIQELSEAVGPISDLLSTAQSREYHHVSVFVHIETIAGQAKENAEPVYANSITIAAAPNIVKVPVPATAASLPAAASGGSSDQNQTPAAISTPDPSAGNVSAPAEQQVTAPAAPEPAKPFAPAVESSKLTVPVPAANSKPDVIPAAPEKENSKSVTEDKDPAPVTVPAREKEGTKNTTPPADVPKVRKIDFPLPAVPKETKAEFPPAAGLPKEEPKPEVQCDKGENRGTDSANDHQESAHPNHDSEPAAEPANAVQSYAASGLSAYRAPAQEAEQKDNQNEPSSSAEEVTSSPEADTHETAPAIKDTDTAVQEEQHAATETPAAEQDNSLAPANPPAVQEEPPADAETSEHSDETLNQESAETAAPPVTEAAA